MKMNIDELRPSTSLSRMDLITITATRTELLRTYKISTEEINDYLVFLHNRTIIVKNADSFYNLSERTKLEVHAHPHRVAMQLDINRRTWGVLVAKENILEYLKKYAPQIDIEKDKKKFRLSLLTPRKH